MVKRFDVCWVNLYSTGGSEIKKTRPAIVVSPDEMLSLKTVIIVPLTTGGKPYPTRILVTVGGQNGFAVLDQIRTIDKVRLGRKIGVIDEKEGKKVLAVLREMFEF